MRLSALIALVLALLVGARAAADSVIELRPAARLAPGSAVTLADVATLLGPEAQRWANTQLAPAGAETVRVDVESIRRAIDQAAQPGRAMWSALRIRGSTCIVTFAHAPPPETMNTPGLQRFAPPPPPASLVDAQGRPLVRWHVARRIAQALNVADSDVKLAWESRDAALLDLPAHNRTVEVRPAGTSERMPLAVRVFDGDREIAAGTVRVGVLIRRNVIVASKPVRRGDVLDAADLTTAQHWLSPTITPAIPADVPGKVARARIAAGAVVLADQVQAPVMIERGDKVSVTTISGGVVLTGLARAVDDAREGQIVELQALDSKRTFKARVSGRGKAVAVNSELPEESR